MIHAIIAAASLAAALHGQAPSLTIRNLDKAGAFRIINEGAEVSVLVKAQIEKKVDTRWIYTGIVYELIEKCPSSNDARLVLRPKQQLSPVPWTGFDCEAQCPRPCRMNHYAGPGEFRLVIQTADKKHRFPGPSFRLPPAPADTRR